MYPAIANGASIKYIIPELNPFAGPSPICSAVFAQMEHCALTQLTAGIRSIKQINKGNNFFIDRQR